MPNVITQLLVFRLGTLRLALRLAVVDRVERAVEVTPLPNTPEKVMGMVNLQGQIVPIFDLPKVLHLPSRGVDPGDEIVFARTERRKVGLVVDAVDGVIERDDQEIVPPSEVLPGLEFVEGVAKLDNGIVLIHNLDSFLSLEEDKALEEAVQHHA